MAEPGRAAGLASKAGATVDRALCRIGPAGGVQNACRREGGGILRVDGDCFKLMRIRSIGEALGPPARVEVVN